MRSHNAQTASLNNKMLRMYHLEQLTEEMLRANLYSMPKEVSYNHSK